MPISGVPAIFMAIGWHPAMTSQGESVAFPHPEGGSSCRSSLSPSSAIGGTVRKGPQQAIVATAHKIVRTVYHLLTYGEAYQITQTAEDERKRQERELRALTRRANKLGYTLAQVGESTPASPG